MTRTLRAALCAVASAAIGVFPVAASARPYDPDGVRITGGADSGAATGLTPGVHVDRLDRGAQDATADGSVRFYAISVRAGETPYVAVTLPAPTTYATDDTLGIEVSLTEPGGTTSCGEDSETDYATDDRLGPVTAVAAPGAAGSEDGCAAGRLIVRVERSGDAAVDKPLQVEIAYRLEPAAAADGQPGPAGSAANLRTDLIGTPAGLKSGTSFTDAPVLGSGVYRDAITAGDIRIVRVHLDWGQRFAFSFSAAAKSGTGDSLLANATVYNPVRQDVALAQSGTSTTYDLGERAAEMSGSTLVPVRYANRRSDKADVVRYSVAGDYYLAFTTTSPDDADASVSIPYTLQIRVAGVAQSGPVYRLPDGATPSPDAARGSSGSGRTPLIISVAAVAVGLALVLLVVLALRRRTQTRSHA